MADFMRTGVETLLTTNPKAGLALLAKRLRGGHLVDLAASMIESGALVYNPSAERGRPDAGGHPEIGFWILGAFDDGEKLEAVLAAAMERFNVRRSKAYRAYTDAREYRDLVERIERKFQEMTEFMKQDQ